MGERLVAADASPPIGMAAARMFDVLRRLYGVVTVTTVVRDEVWAGGGRPGASEVRDAIESGWIRVAAAEPDTGTFPDLDPGESSTLRLALRHRGKCLLLMDEPAGRTHARALGLDVTGVAGSLLVAKQRGFIKAVRPALDALAGNGFRLSRVVSATILEQAGEA